nr:hybrid sensor histidine kinase/response regulator [Bacteroidota bacterium]
METEKFKILIVDDIPTNIQVLGSVLRKAGYEVAFTDNGADAIVKAISNKYDLILLDIMMPQMDGFEVCKILKSHKESEDIPIVFLTAKTDSESLVKGFELGAVDYLTKPFKSPELLARVKTHIALKYTTEELSKSNAMKDKLFSIIAHDLRGPVGNFGSALQVLIENIEHFDKDTLAETLVELKKSAYGAYDLLQNLLKWATTQNNTIEFSPSPLNLKMIIIENIDLLSNTAKQKNIIFNTHIKEDILVFADDNMVKTILRNLFSNSIKFSHNNNRVDVFAEKKGRFAEIIVKDQGVGIKKENLSRIFNFHEYFTTYGTANEKGTGLGLNLCKDFVERNKGEIWIESAEEIGTKIIFTLPLDSN